MQCALPGAETRARPTARFRARENLRVEAMAIYHLSAKLISRKAGRSATAAAAYRAAERIVDARTGEAHDYTQKRGIEHTEIVLPSGVNWTPGRAELWNAVEAKNKRADAQVAREFVVALPDELTPEARRGLAVRFAREIADTYRVAADVCIHLPSKEGDNRNHHAHILTSTNTLNPDGSFGNKARALDLVAHTMGGGAGTANEIDKLRQAWADMANAALEQAGSAERIDHRSLEAQGIGRPPTRHMGPAVAGMARRGASSKVAERMAEEAEARLSAARELAQADRAILDLAGAIREREERQREAERPPKGSTERTGPAVQSSRFKARPTEERQAAPGTRKPQTRRQATAERNERTRQELDAMPIEEQAKAFDIIQNAMAQKLKARLAKFDRLARKATDRRDRRAKAERKLWETEPTPPTGLLASFKRKGHETALGQWRKVQRKAERLKEQAERLKERVGKARSDLAQLVYDNDPYALAKRGLERTNPEFMRRVDAYKAAEREKKNAELVKQAVELGKKRQEQARAELAREFRGLAARRAMKAHGFTDSSRKWQATPDLLREIIDDYNSRPKEQQERALAAWMRDPEQSKTIAAMIEQRRENSRDLGMSR